MFYFSVMQVGEHLDTTLSKVLNINMVHEVDFKDDVPTPDIETTLRDYVPKGMI